jgi:hypothetical protein
MMREADGEGGDDDRRQTAFASFSEVDVGGVQYNVYDTKTSTALWEARWR